MSRILIYSQQPILGGSLRLLLNLARHLSESHDIIVALPPPKESWLFWGTEGPFTDVRIVERQEALDTAEAFDLLVGHFPFELDAVARTPIQRKIAICMEIASRHARVLDDETAPAFDRIVHLHDEQVVQLSPSLRRRLCVRLPIINNVDFDLPFEKTGYLGAVGAGDKHHLPTLLRTIQRSRNVRGLHTWSHQPIEFKWSGLSVIQKLRARVALWQGRFVFHTPELDLRQLYASFDCLVHTPRYGNGTSIVVSDALSCGKLVALSPVPEYRRVYGGLEGVHFIDDFDCDLTKPMACYDEATYDRIRRHYRYDRSDALQRWEESLLT